MNKKKDQKEQAVGYKHPPRSSQFKPGQSGNPKGRPSKTPTLVDTLAKEMKARVSIVRNGRKITISMLDAIVKQLTTKAAQGDPKVASLLFNLLASDRFVSGDPLTDLVREFRALHARTSSDDGNQNDGNT